MSVERESATKYIGVIGGGLAGCTAALEATLDGRFNVLLFEKNSKIGGNSVKASSGINAMDGPSDYDSFFGDTTKSGEGLSKPELVETLVKKSEQAIEFLGRFGVDMPGRVRMGGHSAARTRFNPQGASVGITIMQKLIPTVLSHPQIKVITDASIDKIVSETKDGVPVFTLHYGEKTVSVHALIIATGGFGANKKLLQEVAPRTAKYATTNGPWSTGDGLELGKQVGAKLIHLDKVQVHPTGFVDQNDPDAGSRVVAAEKLRGCGAILINLEGKRFVDELNTRDHVYAKVSQQTDERAWMLLSNAGAEMYNVSHMGFYLGRGLIKKMETLEEVATLTGIAKATLKAELEKYNEVAKERRDEFGKTVFPTVFDLEAPIFVAMITPVVHYCMGGLEINSHGGVLSNTSGRPVPGLFAAGEVTGGLHGENRLGGNSLLDCVVFGREAGSSAVQYLSQPEHIEL